MRTLIVLITAFSRLNWLLRWPVRRVLYKQIYFSGVQSSGLILLIALAVGGIVAGKLHYQIGQSGSGAIRLLASLTLTELAPLITGVVLCARSTSAMASELALMRHQGDITALEMLGVDVMGYLVMPRILGMLAAAGMLSFYFAVAAILAGALGVAGLAWPAAITQLPAILTISMLWQCMGKGLAFGAGIAAVACRRGLIAAGGGTDVPIAASQAVVRALLVLFGLDLVFISIAYWG